VKSFSYMTTSLLIFFFFLTCISFDVSSTYQMFLQSQSKNKIIAYLATISISLHVLLSWLLTVQFKFGLNGALTSTILAYWIPNLGQLVSIMTKCPDTWKGFSFMTFKDLSSTFPSLLKKIYKKKLKVKSSCTRTTSLFTWIETGLPQYSFAFWKKKETGRMENDFTCIVVLRLDDLTQFCKKKNSTDPFLQITV